MKIDVSTKEMDRNSVYPRIYVFHKGETMLDNLINRAGRPYKVYKTNVIPEVLDQLGLDRNTKMRWSRTAGCSCGCSPGFIINQTLPNGRSVMRNDVFVTLSAENGDVAF